MIQLRDVTKAYRMGKVAVPVLHGINLTIDDGEMVAIMGPSGSGKSTLMNILGCLDIPTSGHYLLDGTDVSRLPDKRLAKIRSHKIGFVFQSFNLIARTSAIRNVERWSTPGCELDAILPGGPWSRSGWTNAKSTCLMNFPVASSNG